MKKMARANDCSRYLHIKAIIFDVDGVIFKTHDEVGNYLWSRTIKEDLGITSKHFSMIFSEKWGDITRGKIDLIEHLEEVFKDKLFGSLSISPQDYIKYWFRKDHNVNAEILKLVEQLQLPCYLGTNQEALRTKHISSTVGQYFAGCFASCEIGFVKPEREFFQHIENTLSLAPEELVLIDDTRVNINGAKQYGWHTYHYQNDREELEEFLAELIDQ